MNLKFTYRDNNNRLLLIFAGWGMDADVFAGVHRSGYDIAVAWDYRSEDTDLTPLDNYGEIALMAWSMGVAEADRILSGRNLPLSLTVAVNGTLHPVDDRKGIPAAIFDGTLNGLSERSLMKFHRRMCGSAESFARFKQHIPPRDITELTDELRAIRQRPYTPDAPHLRWDKAVVSDNDAIIPTANQLEAWRGTEITLIPGPHLPDWQILADTLLIDKELVHDRFAKGFTTYEQEADVQTHAAQTLWHLWQRHSSTGHTGTLIEIGYGTGIFTRMYAPEISTSDWQLWDLVAPYGTLPANARPITCDAEARIHSVPDHSVSKIVSASAIQWFNSLPAFLHQAGRVLEPGGELIASTFGPLTFRELTAAGAAPLPYPDITGLRRHINDAGLKMTHISDEIIGKRFASAHDVLRHIRATGVNAVGATATAARVRGILANYPLEADGSAILTYQPIYIIASKS